VKELEAAPAVVDRCDLYVDEAGGETLRPDVGLADVGEDSARPLRPDEPQDALRREPQRQAGCMSIERPAVGAERDDDVVRIAARPTMWGEQDG
jgi:hypothetical protein